MGADSHANRSRLYGILFVFGRNKYHRAHLCKTNTLRVQHHPVDDSSTRINQGQTHHVVGHLTSHVAPSELKICFVNYMLLMHCSLKNLQPVCMMISLD